MDEQQEGSCYGPGSIAGAVLGTCCALGVVLALAALLYRLYWRSRRGKHLVLVTDPESACDQYAFDNPCFKDATPIVRNQSKDPVKIDLKTPRWSAWSTLVGKSTEKKQSHDDSCLGAPQTSVVDLRSRDFTGLGFNVCGNIRDGIFIKDLLHHGPAGQSGQIRTGDRISALRVSFRHMVLEDAMTILSYASPYEVQLELERGAGPSANTTISSLQGAGATFHVENGTSGTPANAASGSTTTTTTICHPFYRSCSSADLTHLSKESLKKLEAGLNDASRFAAVLGVRVLPPVERPTNNIAVVPLDKEKVEIQKQSMDEVDTKLKLTPIKQFDERAIDVEWGNNSSSAVATLHKSPNHHETSPNTSTNSGSGGGGSATGNVKQRLAKGLQNLKGKLNVTKSSSPEPTESPTQQQPNYPNEIPEEVARAARAARDRRPSSEAISIEGQIQTEDENPNNKNGNNGKRKAPSPPAVESLSSSSIESETNQKQTLEMPIVTRTMNINNHNGDNDNDADSDTDDKRPSRIELDSSHVTVHAAATSETEPDPQRKAASLGDLSRLETTPVVSLLLERAVSLELDNSVSVSGVGGNGVTMDGTNCPSASSCGSQQRKRKAPLPPPGGSATPRDSKLKKSSDWGTMEQAIIGIEKAGLEDDSLAVNINTSISKRLEDHLTTTPAVADDEIDNYHDNDDNDNELSLERNHKMETSEINLELANDYPDLDSPISFQLEGKDNLMKNIEEALSNSKEFKFLLKEEEEGPSSSLNININPDSTDNLGSKEKLEVDSSVKVVAEQLISSSTNEEEPITWSSRWSPAVIDTNEKTITNGDLCDSSSSPDGNMDKMRSQSPADSAVSLSEGSFTSLPVVTSTPHPHQQHQHLITTTTTSTNSLIHDATAYLTARQDDTPPELPTSPVPPPSSLVTTYITEIQVLTSPTEVSSGNHSNGGGCSYDSLSSGGSGDDEEMEAIMSGGNVTGNHVTVTSIRSTAPPPALHTWATLAENNEVSTTTATIPTTPSATTTTSMTKTSISPTKSRPPVPPRKSSITTPSITTTTTTLSTNPDLISSTTISTSSTSTTPINNNNNNSNSPSAISVQIPSFSANNNKSTFEQWVFLDDGTTHNNTKTNNTTNGGGTVVTANLPPDQE